MNVIGLKRILDAMEDFEPVMIRIDDKILFPIPSVEADDTGKKTLYLNNKPIKGYHYD